MQPSSDHQVQDQPHIIVQSDGDALADAPQFPHLMTFCLADGRLRRAQQKRAADPCVLERLADDALSSALMGPIVEIHNWRMRARLLVTNDTSVQINNIPGRAGRVRFQAQVCNLAQL